jgi:hypothetical protein
MESSSQEKSENEVYLESNELNKLMETLMGQIRMHKPQDIVIQFYSTIFRLASLQATCDRNTEKGSHVI